MGRKFKFNGGAKAIALTTAQTVTFTSSDIDSTGVVAYLFSMQPAGNTVSDIDRVRVRAGSQVLVELTQAQLLAYQQMFSKANTFDATTAQAFIIPLNLLDAPTPDIQDKCQFPPGTEAQVEIVFLNTTVAGSIMAGWITSDIKPELFMRAYTRTGNVPASTRNFPFPFSDSGIVRAIGFDTRGVDRAECQVSGLPAFLAPGVAFQGLAWGDMLNEKDILSSLLPIAALNYGFHLIETNVAAANGTSNLLLDTQAAWPGAASEIALYVVDKLENFRG